MSDKPEVLIYCDGGCEPNPGLGAWAAVLLQPSTGKRREMSASEAKTTNNRMELMAVIKGLEALKVPCSVTVVTDSQYVMHAFTKGWLAKWTRNGWRTSANKDVKNVDLWQRLKSLYSKHDVEWKWVKGHSGDAENERCDQMVVGARRKARGLLP